MLGRVFVDVNGGYRSRSLSFSDTRRDAWFGETASWTADYEVKNGPALDTSAGVRVWRTLVARVGYTRFTDTRAAAIVGSVPHPFFFNQERGISGESPGLKQEEQALHLGALWAVPVNPRLEVAVFGGPSLFQLKRDLVEDVRYADSSYPYDNVAFDGTIVKTVKDQGFGFHAGADVAYFFTRTVGVGALVQFTRGRVDLTSPATGGSLSVDVGGLQAGGGIRLRFGGRPARASRPAPPASRRPSDDRRTDKPTQPARPSERPYNTPVPTPGQAAAPEIPEPRTHAYTRVAAPVFIVADATREPLVVLRPRTRVKVLEQDGEWLRIEFSDPRWGARVGWVQRTHCDW
jgi:hypothetical protein